MMSFKRMLNKLYYYVIDKMHRKRKVFVVISIVSLAIIFVQYFLMSKPSHDTAEFPGSNGRKSSKPEEPGTSLDISGPHFKLKGKPFTILGGSIHYFRVLPDYWEDRLYKLKAMGLNTVVTYIPWNVHEEIHGNVKFDQWPLDIVSFVKTAHRLGLYVIIRPGPYICAEWDLGGLPSWLLHNPKQRLRTNQTLFLADVERYFAKLLPLLAPLQYSEGGPIIAWQIENEYSIMGNDMNYMRSLYKMMLKYGVTELMFTSDPMKALKQRRHNLTEVLMTINLQSNEKEDLEELKKLQPNRPLMVTEFWPGWFDHWGEEHHVMSVKNVAQRVANILDMGASINLYMFHGGTNFGFMNGANLVGKKGYQPTITSYDYDAPLSEAGDITPKYEALRKVIRALAPNHSVPTEMSKIPANIKRTAYAPVEMNGYIPLRNVYKYVGQAIKRNYVLPMEELLINRNGGQSHGFIVYRNKLPKGAKRLFIEKYRDRAQVMVGSQLVATLDTMDLKQKYMKVDEMSNVEVELKYKPVTEDDDEELSLEILVENMGRNNFGDHMDDQRKGILGQVLVDDKKLKSWVMYPLSFTRDFVYRAFLQESWETFSRKKFPSPYPGFFKGTLTIPNQPQDTFLVMDGWGKGVVFVNYHNIGRYWKIGPQKTLYVPASFLLAGENVIVIFELERRSQDGKLKFSTDPDLGNPVEVL